MPHPRKGATNDVKDAHAPRQEGRMVVSDVTVNRLVAGALPEERVVAVDGGRGSSQVPSLAEPRLRVDHLVEQPSGLWEVRLYQRASRAEEVEEDEVLDRGELGGRGFEEQAPFGVRVDVARSPFLCEVPGGGVYELMKR